MYSGLIFRVTPAIRAARSYSIAYAGILVQESFWNTLENLENYLFFIMEMIRAQIKEGAGNPNIYRYLLQIWHDNCFV
jgi:hypothetical protein